MNVNIIPPISVTLNSGYLVSEDSYAGTIRFEIEEQQIFLVLTTSRYTYDTVFAIGDRVKIIQAYGAFGVDSEGVLQAIIIDSTDDKGDVYFDLIYPDNQFNSLNKIKSQSGNVSVLFRVPLRYLAKV